MRQAHPALRGGQQWHIGWDESYYAFLRESPEEKLLVVYNNSQAARDLKIPVADTPLQDTRTLQVLFGVAAASVAEGEVRFTLQQRSLAVYAVH